jgi:hypothetical protein
MTMFIPSNQALLHLSKSGYDRYHKFTISDKYIFGEAHILPAYYTLSALQISKTFMQLIVASIDMKIFIYHVTFRQH